MAFPRTNVPLRLQQILLSGGRAAIPSLKLESEPPPDVKAFIDRVIKSPLQDIDIPLSGFHWEFNKGNFHHWRPLFLHFDTYFKTYISCRKDLRLSDDMLDEDVFPKHSVLQILRVMQIILTNCHNKSSFSGLEHFRLLLSSTDPEILLATLETLSALVKINPSKLHGSGKSVGCGSLNNSLMSLAQGWGSKEEGLGLFSCVVTNEKSQQSTLSLFPSDIDDDSSGNQNRMGSTLHFEFRSATSQVSNMCVVHFPDLHLRKEDDLTILKQCVDMYNVPLEHRFPLLTRIRYAHAFRSPRICSLYSRICILAFAVLVQSGDAHDELVSFFANEPEYTNELIRLVRAEEFVPDIVKALSMFALGAELAAYTFSHERGRILSGSSIISAGGNRMLLLTVLQKAILSLTSQSDPSSILLVEALLQFFLLHVLSSSSSGSAIRGSGLVSPLLPLLKNTESAHMHLVCSAVKTLQKLMEYSSPAVSLFKDLGGVETLSQRLEIEVRKVTGSGESSSTVILGDSSKSDADRLYTQKRLIKVLLKALGSATYSPANSTRSLNPPDKSLLGSFSLIFQCADRFGAEIYFSAVTVMSEILHKDPTCFPVLEEFGIPKAFLSSVSVGVIPSSKALICIPGALGAMCLNTKGLEYVKDTGALWFLENAFTTKKYLAAMNEGVVLLANAVEELLRHVSSLRSVGVDIIIKIVSKLASIGEDKCPVSDKKLEDDNAMEVDVDDKENMSHNLVDTMESDSDDISNEQFLQLCVFHVMVLVHRTVENSETCRLFVEKKGIDVLIKLLLQPCIAQSSEGMPVALHSTVVFKSFTQHHSSPLALAFCSALRSHVDGALGGLKSASSTFLLDPKSSPDSRLLSPLFVIEFLLFLAACKDHRWVAALLSEFGNGSKDVLENIGRLHREVLWQISLLENSKSEMQAESPISSTETQISDGRTNGNEEQRFNYMRRYLDPLSRRRTSGLSIESQFLDLIGMYQGSGRVAGGSRRAGVDVSGDSQLVTNSQSEVPNTSEASSVNKNEADKQKSYYSSCRDMMKSLSYHIDHLFQELGKAMLVSSRRGSDSVNMSSSAKSVVRIFSSIILDHLKFTGPIDLIPDTDAHVPTRCRYLGKVTDFIETIISDKPDTCNPILINCFYSSGVIDNILTTFEATSQLLLSVNKASASPMETDEENLKSDEKEETENSWIYGPLSSYGTLMDHLVTSSFIMSSSTKQLLEQPLIDGDVSFPRGAEAFVKVLQSKVLKAVLPIWNNPRIAEYSHECIASTISTIRHVFSGVDTRNVGGNPGARLSGPPPDESTITLITEMGFSRSRAEEALRQVGTNSVELATDWLFSHPEEPQDDDELARALKLSLGNSGTSSSKECSSTDETFQEVELAQLPPVDELLSTCIRLLHADESLAFPVKDLLLIISTRNDGEFRSKVVEHIIGQLKGFALSGTGDKAMMSPLFHVLALLLHEDEPAREIANKCGLVTIVLDVLSQWDPLSSDGEKPNVPKWVTASFLAIDLMLQLDLKVAPEAIALEKLQRSDLNHQTSIGTDENKSNSSVLSSGKAAGILEVHDRNRLIDLACKCIKSQLPSDTMHVVLQMCATLTRVHSVALAFFDLGGLPALLNLPTGSMFPGFDNIASAIIRHILEDPNTLQQAMESEIRHSLVAASNRHLNGRVTPRNFVQNLSSVISRDPAIFMKAAQAVCQIEMSGDRPYVVLLKDHDKDKAKEKEKVIAKEKVSASNSKLGTEDAGSCKQPENNNKSVKVHRKIPPNFSSVIELLLDSVTLFVPSTMEGDAPGDGNSSANMDIDSTSDKVKGKAVAMSAGDREIANQEALVSLAKSVFILKLLTEILLTFPLAIQVLLRRDSDISNFRTLPRGNPSNIGGGIFHHILHKFLPHSGPAKKDKKSDTDWRQKLAARAKQFLVASSVRSGEARKRIFSEIHKVSGEFVDSSVGCVAPNTKLQAFIDVLNEMLSARTSTGSYISAEASATFIDVGLVCSLTRLLKILDLDHADSPKIVSGIIKALELVTKEYAHSAEPSATKGGSSTKMANEHNDLVGGGNDGNRFRSLETMSQPDQSGMMADHMDSVNAAQNSGSSDSVTDEMDHDRDLDGSFTREGQDYFMRETSEAGRSTDNGVTNVEIFDIPRNAEDNLDDEEDDEDMSGDEGEMDEEEDDDENNDLEEDDIHHMSHPETDQDDHDVDEEFDEDVLEEEEEDDEDDEDGVILRLEEGIHGINVFDQIELLGPGGNNLSNETLRVMPLEVFGSRRRSQSIYDLMGRAAGHAVSSEHPLLAGPSLGHVGHQRRSVNVVEAAFSDRSTESSSSRFDSVFRSLVRERHGHRFSMWVDDTRQRVGSTANMPQGIEDVLLSLLRRPTPEGREQTNQVISPGHCPEQDETHQTDEVEVGRNEEPREGSVTADANLVAPPPPSPTSELDGGRENGSALGGVTQQEHDIPNLNEQVMSMQYERSDPIARDVEAVSLESGGSSATLGESLRSLEVEIGSADGHDDGDRQGEMHQVARSRRPTGSTIPPSGRDPSLESVSEVPVPPCPTEEAGQDSAVEQQPTRNASSGSIDPTFLEALPEELRAEVLSAQQNQTTQPSNDQPQATDDIDPEFLAALPPDIRAEVLAQQQAQRVHQSQELEGQPVEMDTVSIIATFPSDLREEVLLTSPDNVLASLTPALVAEANMLRERFAHRYHGGTLFGMHPRNRRGESSRRGDAFGSNLDRIGGSASRRSSSTKMIEADGAPLVKMEELKAMIRLLRVVQPLYKGQLQRLLLNLCSHSETRSFLLQLLMDMLLLDVRGHRAFTSVDDEAEPLYRLYGGQSYIAYSRPQFSDGVPPLVSRRILETLTYLARNHPNVARLFLHLELPKLQADVNDKGRGKAVVMEEDNPEEKKGNAALVLLLSLLNQPLYSRSVAHLEQLLTLLEVVVGGAESDLNLNKNATPEQVSGTEGNLPEAPANAIPSGSSSEKDVKSSGCVTDLAVVPSKDNLQDTRGVLLSLPEGDLQRLCSLLAHEGLSDGAYTLVAEVLKKLVAIVPHRCQLFVTELANSVQKLSVSAINELRMYDDMEKSTISSSSSDGTAILRVLQALSSLVSTLHGKKNDLQLHDEKGHNDALSSIWSINTALEPLWSELSASISKIEVSSESTSVASSATPLSVGINLAPPLPVGSQNILPYIESFFVTCEKIYPEHPGVQDINSTIASGVEDALTSGSGHKMSGNTSKADEKHPAFMKFSEKHRKILNAFIRQNPGLLEKSFSLLLKVPRFIDFDNKRAHFRTKIKHQHDHHHSSLRISVRRAYILEDSYNQLRMRSPQDLKGRLTVHFQGEEGIDAGGLTREWYQLLSRVVFDKGALLFTTVGNESTFQPNPNSVYQTEHLSYFKFVGRVVGKALFDGQLLDVHFTRSFYKHILGVKVTYHDIEAIDPDYFKNLKWMLENYISDTLGLTFSIDADEEKLILYERTEVTDHELIPGGRNIRVTEENKHEYVDLVAEHRLTTAIRPQINAFMEGFNDLISRDLISIFNDKELELLISGLPDIDLDDLRANTEYSGYSNASPVIQWFWEVVQGLSKEDKARLLQFVTGTSKVPLEGFSALQGISGSQKFQIHKAYGSPDHLPSAHTCFNQLDLPEYPSKEQLQERLLLAIHEGSEGFGFG